MNRNRARPFYTGFRTPPSLRKDGFWTVHTEPGAEPWGMTCRTIGSALARTDTRRALQPTAG